jgi:hypothetical protein
VTVYLLAQRTVISNDVYEILDYVLNARMVSIKIDAYVLIFVRLMVAITKGVVNYFGDQCLDSCPIYSTFCLYPKRTMLV